VNLKLFTKNIFLDILFPPKCLACGLFFRHENDGPMKCKGHHDRNSSVLYPFICPECLKGFTAIESPLCTMCGLPFSTKEGGDHPCGNCISSPPECRMLRSIGKYSGVLRQIIYNFKYQDKPGLAHPLGEMLFHLFLTNWGKRKIDFIVPVPLHIKRFRTRGFNQSFLLVKNWALLGKAESKEITLPRVRKKVLIREKSTVSQTGIDRKSRIINVKNAFKVIDEACVKGKRILLIDDVYTTGATMNECAKTLKKSGALSVDGLTLARTV